MGFGQAKAFGRSGASIAVADVRSETVAAAVSQLRNAGIDAHGFVPDVTDREADARMADELEATFGGPPSVLSNTAGVNSFGPAENTTYDDFDWIIGVNLNGMVTFVPRMIATGRPGHVVTTASLGGFMGSSLAAPYSAAKAAVVNLMASYRQSQSLEPYGIGVSVVCPANIKSNIPRQGYGWLVGADSLASAL